MKKRNRIDGANSLFRAKVNELVSAISWLKPEDKKDFIVFDIEEFRAGRLIEKLDQCIRNINDIGEELDFINPGLHEEEESVFELEGGEERFADQYRYGVFTELINQESRSDDTPF